MLINDPLELSELQQRAWADYKKKDDLRRPTKPEPFNIINEETYNNETYDKYVVTKPTLRDSYLLAIFNDYTGATGTPMFYVDFCIQESNYFLTCNCNDYFTIGTCIHVRAIKGTCDIGWSPPTLDIYYYINYTKSYEESFNLLTIAITRPIIATNQLLYTQLCKYVISGNKNTVSNEVSINAYKKSRNIEMRNV